MAEDKKSKAVKPVKAEKKVKIKKHAPETEEKHSKVMEILKKEYAFENWLLAILAPVLILYGVYIVIGKFGSVNLADILGTSGVGFIDFFFNTALKRILTGSFLILIGVLVVIYLAIPILRPSIAELKKVSWPSAGILARNTTRVFAFLVFLMVVFTLFGMFLEPMFKWLFGL